MQSPQPSLDPGEKHLEKAVIRDSEVEKAEKEREMVRIEQDFAKREGPVTAMTG